MEPPPAPVESLILALAGQVTDLVELVSSGSEYTFSELSTALGSCSDTLRGLEGSLAPAYAQVGSRTLRRERVPSHFFLAPILSYTVFPNCAFMLES